MKNTRPAIGNDPSLQTRGEMVQGSSLFISLHLNAPRANALATTGWARTATDRNKLNTTSNKPATLVFVVKP